MTSRPTRPVLEEFEPRILYSADFAPAALAGLSLPGPSDQRLLQAQETPAATPAAMEIAFVDLSLPEAQTLIDDLQAQRDAGRTIEIVRINAGEDGISRISEALNGRTDISAVHVLSHGSDGAVQLGSVRLDAATLLVRAGELAQWSAAFTSRADLLLYGCDVAQSAAGQQFVYNLGALTGADVTASTDLTGAAARGANWTLEYQVGHIETTLAPSVWEQARWQGVMATYSVTTTVDSVGASPTPGSLRWAISQANANPGTDTIVFAVNGTFNMTALVSGDNSNTTGDFDVNGNLNIVGNGTGNTVINGNGVDRVFDLRSGTISLSGLTVQGGQSNQGAGISVGTAANVTLTDVVIQNNAGSGASKGGGIYNDGVLTLQNSIVQNNGSGFLSNVDGAGIYNDASATISVRDVEIRNNIAAGGKDGGGLYVWSSASVQLTNVTFANNQATRGGGLWNHSNVTSLLNVTFSGNFASSEGGGIWADRNITLDHVTVANNSAAFWGGGTYDSNNSITAKNSLFAGNTGGNTNRAPVSQGYNLSDDNSPGFLGTGDQKNVAAGLLGLSNNGGFTRTHAIDAGSAARDAANPVPAVGTDQRGIAYSGGRADIGAYEYNPTGFAPTISAVANQTIDENTALGPITFTIGDVESGAGSLVVTATSSNTALVPNAIIVLGGPGSSRTISLTPAPNANSSANGGPTTITLSVSDGGNVTTTTFTVTVQSVNNAPTLTLPAAQTVDEATQLVLSGTNAPSIGDVDAGTAPLQVAVTATNGTLKLSQITGLSFVTGNSGFNATMTFSGSLADINAALDGLNYKPVVGYNGAAQIDLSVNDLGNSGSGGAKTASGSIAINVVAVNDAPRLGLPGAQATPQPTPLTFGAASANAITVSDVDAGSSNVQLTLSTSALANGTLSFGSTAGLTLVSGTGTNDTSVVLRGTLADLNAALGTLSFSATGAGAARIDITIDDFGNTGSGGAKQASGAVTITVATDALPVLTLSQTTLNFTENATATPLDAGLTISDSDNPTFASAVVRINSGYAGAEDVLAFTNVPATMGDIAGSYSAGVLSLSSAGQTATLAEWQAALRSITYVNTSDAPSTAPRTVTLTVNDGIADSGTRNITLNVQAFNDAPVLGGANNLASITEDTVSNPGTLVATLIAGQISDVDTAAQAGIAVTGANDANGVWQYTTDGTSWSAFGVVSDASARLLAADTNSAVRFVPNSNWNGTLAAGLTFRAWDQSIGSGSAGGTADTSVNGGSSAFSSATASSGITVTPINDAPVLAGPIAAQAATQGVGFAFTLPGSSFTDADAGDVLTYTATLASGAALPAWLSFDAGTQTFSGTPANADVGSINVRITARDGSDGSFGDFTLDIANVNDTPLLAAPIGDQAATQDVAFVFNLPANSFTDADVGDVLSYSATLASGAALPTWLSFDANTLTFTGTPANADVGAINVRVTASDTSSAAVFDDFTLTVANVNDAPVITSNGGGAAASVNVAENNPTVTGVTATDSDALDVLRFAITGGADAARFGIDPVSGALSFVVAPDRELPADANRDNRYEVIVSVSDGALSAQQSLFIDVANVDEAPSIVTNALLLSNSGATLVLLGTDPDTGASALSYQASSQVGGRFELVAAPGVAVTGFNQAQVDAGAVRFVADGSGTSPTYVLSLSDGVSTVTSGAPNVVQQASPPIAALPVAPAVAPPATPPAATTTAAAPAAAPPAAAPPAAVPATPGPLATALLAEPRGDTFEPARTPSSSAAVAVPAASTATRDSTVTAVATLAQFALLSESSDNAATAGAPTIDLASALRDRLLGEQLDQQRDSAGGSQRSVKDLQAASALLTTGLSVGYVLWLARGGVLVASLMSALPAWAMVDPLPVLAQMKRRDGRADDGAADDAADDPLEKLFSKARQVVARGAAPPLTASTPSEAKLAQGRSAADKNSLEQPA